MLEIEPKQVWVGVMMKRIGVAAILVALAGSVMWPAERAHAQSASAGIKVAQAAPQDPAAPPRLRRPPPRIRVTPYEQEGVYPHYYPGPNAVRVCNATYVQEFRPSGTVIVPRMSCHWTRG
jgi:hypothetical protein